MREKVQAGKVLNGIDLSGVLPVLSGGPEAPAGEPTAYEDYGQDESLHHSRIKD